MLAALFVSAIAGLLCGFVEPLLETEHTVSGVICLIFGALCVLGGPMSPYHRQLGIGTVSWIIALFFSSIGYGIGSSVF